MSGFSNKMKKLEKFFKPTIKFMEEQKHLQAVKRSMLTLLPITIIGSFTLVAMNIVQMVPNSAYANFMTANENVIMLLFNFSMGLMGLYTALFVAYFLADSYKMYPVGSCITSIIMFLVLNSGIVDGSIDTTFLDAKGMFPGIFVAIISVEITRYLNKKKFIIKMPEGVPDMVTKNFEIIIPLIVNSLLFLFLRIGVFKLTGLLVPEIVLKAMSPFVTSLNTVWGVMFLVFMIQLLWWFGIHGDAALSPIFLPIALQNVTENAAAYGAGEPLKHVFTETVLGNFFLMSGSGITIGLVILMLLSKAKRYRSLGKISILPAIFGINEPVTFGTPIVYNPVMFVPYVIGPTILSFFIYMAFKIGFVPMAFIQSPSYTPWLLQGYLMNLSLRSAVLQILILIASIVMYYPFFKIIEREELLLEDDKKEVDKELEDLDLDF